MPGEGRGRQKRSARKMRERNDCEQVSWLGKGGRCQFLQGGLVRIHLSSHKPAQSFCGWNWVASQNGFPLDIGYHDVMRTGPQLCVCFFVLLCSQQTGWLRFMLLPLSGLKVQSSATLIVLS